MKHGAADVIPAPFDESTLDRLVEIADSRPINGAVSASSATVVANHPRDSISSNGVGGRNSDGESARGGDARRGREAQIRGAAASRTDRLAAGIAQLESFLFGSSPAMRSIRRIIAEVADTKANVMIYGASGTGKELVANAVHRLSSRRDRPFVPVNITEIPHELAESLLFGHEKGSFTGAETTQLGVCEAADGGTLFLDEIGEMSLSAQPKLLRFLQEGTVKRIGANIHRNVDVRVITATNRDPDLIVRDGSMREDLFFRLHVVPIHLPPLRERAEDIEQLATLFLRRYASEYGRGVEGFSDEVIGLFQAHDWPGNVRQLENLVERLVVFAKGRQVEAEEIPAEFYAGTAFNVSTNGAERNGVSRLRRARDAVVRRGDASISTNAYTNDSAAALASMTPMQRTERSAIIEALQRVDGHVVDAAHLLGVGQATIYRKIKRYRIPHNRRRRRAAK